jgi:alpha-tubulin suppressor-like RCC1 family protein
MKRIRSIGLWLVVALVAGGGTATMAAASTYGVNAWGENEYGQLGHGGGHSTVPLQLSAPTEVTAVSAGEEFSLALEGGTVKAWGDNDSGQLGVGSFSGPEKCGTSNCSKTPMTVHELSGVTAISAGYNYGLALRGGGTVKAWGENRYGELGDNSETSSDVPVEVSGLNKVTAISAGEYHSLALLEDHEVEAWGFNEFGQLGDGTFEGPEKCSGYACSKIPVKVSGLTEVSAVSAGISHSLALLKDGKVVAWGENRFGELGGGTENSDVPVEVPGLSNVIAISAGGDFSLALLENGTVMAWGDNETGELGDGNATGPEKCSGVPCSRTPVEVKGLSKITAISAGFSDSLALRENGTVVAWGWNEYGQLGDGSANGPEKCGTEACSRAPVAVSRLVRDVAGVSAGAFASLADGPPGPIVSSVSPDTGSPAGGTPVTITGLNFTGVTGVEFGGTPATIVEVKAPTTIVVESPAGSGSVHITVTTSSGTIATSEENSASRFRYVTTAGPEYGRCVKVAPGLGEYAGAACEVKEAGGSYEWKAGVTKAHFTLAGAGATFETNTKVKLVCKASSGAGEYTSAKEVGNTTIKFTECEYEGAKCTSAGAATGEVVTSSLEGELGWKEILHSQVALALFPTGEVGPFAEFKCGSTGVVVVGSVLVPVTTDTMSTSSVLEYTAVKGDQKPQKFEGGLKDVLEFSFGGEAFKRFGLTTTITQTSEEAVEVNSVV